MPNQRVVVGAAIIREVDGMPEVLSAQRKAPDALAGMWEFAGGKVEPGEDEVAALRRECREELGVDVVVGERIGPDVEITGGGATLRVWTVGIVAGAPTAVEHETLRWLDAETLYDVAWLPADLPIVDALHAMLSR